MKKLLFLLLLAAITATAYAEKNHKTITKSKTKLPQQAQTVMPANPVSNNDTAWHGSGNEHQYGQRELDPRLGRSMHVDPSAQPHNSNPYQSATSKPLAVKMS